jgi:hypothetical protein
VTSLCTDWQHDEFSGHGSYSHFNVGTGDVRPLLEVLRTGIGPERGIWFAGEHVAPEGALTMSVGRIGEERRLFGKFWRCKLPASDREGELREVMREWMGIDSVWSNLRYMSRVHTDGLLVVCECLE